MRTYGVKGSFSNTIDVDVIKRYNEEIAKTPNSITAYYRALSDGNGNIVRCNKATRDLIASQNGAAVSTEALKQAQDAASKSGSRFAGAMKTIKGALTNFAIMWAISALIEFGKWAWQFVPTVENLNKQLEGTAQALADIKSEREGLNDELKTTEERIAELETKGVLSFTDEAELNRLNKENAALKTKIELLDIEAKKTRERNQKNFNKLIDKKETNTSNTSWASVDYHGNSEQYRDITDKEKLLELAKIYDEVTESKKDYLDARGFSHSIEDVENEITNFSSVVQEYQGYLDDLYQDGFDYNSADEKTKQNIDFANEMIDRYMVLVGKTATAWERAYNSDRFTEARKSIEELAVSGKLTAESLQNLYNQGGNVKEFINYMLSLNTVDWKTMLGDKFTEVADEDGIVSLDEALKAMSGDTELASKIMGLFANELNKVEEAAEDAETSFKSIAKTLSDGLDKLSNKKDILSEVKEELDGFGAISADNISKILEQFSDNDDVQKAVAYYLSGIGTAQQLYDAMAKGYQNDLKLQAEKLATQMQNDENYFNALKELNGGHLKFQVGNYSIDLSKCKDLAAAKLEVEQSLIKKLKKDWQGYYGIQADNLEMAQRQAAQIWAEQRKFGDPNSAFYKQAKHNWEVATEAYGQYLQMEERLNNLSLSSFNASGFNTTLSTDFDDDSGKTEAEKYFDELKYKLETNQITQEQYLKDLDWGYKHFYNKTADYLEDYAKYSQEVYDGFKDMYKEDLEAQKETWEEKKDAVSEYYDNLREQIENAHDEEDYEKEQSEKRKEIFDLDMQIAELMREGSEKAKARIAELEEERLKAEEELLDFETDKAREDELSRLEKEQESEEAKIQKQIDGIQGQLDKLDEDTISVRNAIIAYAKQKGVTLDFAYASGTRSSVGGFGRINEKGIEMISAPDGNGNYIPMLPSSYVFSAKATEFLWKLATEHSLPQAMYNSIAKSIKAQSSTPSVNIAQPISITMGDVIIKGNADKQTVADIKRQQENTVRMVLQKIKELQK